MLGLAASQHNSMNASADFVNYDDLERTKPAVTAESRLDGEETSVVTPKTSLDDAFTSTASFQSFLAILYPMQLLLGNDDLANNRPTCF